MDGKGITRLGIITRYKNIVPDKTYRMERLDTLVGIIKLVRKETPNRYSNPFWRTKSWLMIAGMMLQRLSYSELNRK